MMVRLIPAALEQVRWHPPRGYLLDIEVLSVAELRRRGSSAHFARPQRVEFHVLTAVTRDRCRHVIDFTPHHCRAGTWLTLHPGQMQHYDFSQPWAGWSIVFRPELVLPARESALLADQTIAGQLAELPGALSLSAIDHALCTRIVRQMLADATCAASIADRNALLQYQIYQLLLRLRLAHSQQAPPVVASAANVRRVNRLRLLVERDLRRHHDVHHYASLLGCTEKTLTRSTHAVAGVSAKTLLSRRLVLEAKRLLVHTGLTVQAIADNLGFDESTNFVKFFHHLERCSPGAFRRLRSPPR